MYFLFGMTLTDELLWSCENTFGWGHAGSDHA